MLDEDINQAVYVLKAGGLVAFPTETVYGLGADAKNDHAIKRIYQAKGRPIDHPVIVHIAEISELSNWAKDISPQARQLAEMVWPGPMTLILNKLPEVSTLLSAGQTSIGLRIPHHPVAKALLKKFGSGLAAPSANRFGRISPTNANAVREELGDRVDLILEGGQCEIGVESTIVDVREEGKPRILRPGIIQAEQIEAILKCSLLIQREDTPRVSGSLASHYAPVTSTRLIIKDSLPTFLTQLSEEDLPCAIVARNPIPTLRKGMECVIMPKDPKGYARELYKTLRRLDKRSFRQIIIEAVPNSSEWYAIQDRLQRACA